MKNKAQVMTMDVYVSIVFFVMIFALWVFISNQLIAQAQEAYEISMMDKKLQRISDLLIRTKGIPEDWNEDNVNSIGLADSEYVVNYTKLRKFANMGTEKARNILGFGNYKFYLNITNLTGHNFPEGVIEAGEAPSNPTIVLSIKRFFLLDFTVPCNTSSTLYLDRQRYSPYLGIPWQYSAFTSFPKGVHKTIVLYDINTGGNHVYFYQNPPNFAGFTVPGHQTGEYNVTLYLKNIGSENGKVFVKIKYYDSTGVYGYSPPNNLWNEVGTDEIGVGDEGWFGPPQLKWENNKDTTIPPGGGFLLDVWAEDSNFTLYFDGSQYPSNFMVPVSYPVCDWPTRNEVGVMNLILWR